jgi:CRISPR-associated protein Csb2
MFGIAVELLCERYTATQFNDRDRTEWPPHPGRLFSAMVAAWADSDQPDPSERSALRWLEGQDPPEICCGNGSERRLVTHYVPVNDAAALARNMSRTYEVAVAASRTLRDAESSGDEQVLRRAEKLHAKVQAKMVADGAKAGTSDGRESPSVIQVLPEYRNKQGRTYPTVIPDHPTVWFQWPDAEASDADFAALDALLGRVGRLGHSSSFVACRCVCERFRPTWVPSPNAEQRLRVPAAGLTNRLERAFERHRGEEPRALPAGMVGYQRARTKWQEPRSPLLGGDWYVLGIKNRRLPSAVQALAIARAARGALLSHGAQPSPEILSGHRRSVDESQTVTPPLERPHLAVVPLLSVGHRHSDGSVSGIAVVLPRDCSPGDRLVVEHALRGWALDGFSLLLAGGSGRLMLEDLGIDRVDGQTWVDEGYATRRKTTTRGYWCRPARRWLTVTPIALDRFPGNLRSRVHHAADRAAVEASESIARACVYAGLIDRPDDAEITVRLDSPLVGVPASPSGGPRSDGQRRYPRFETGNGTARACVHAEIEFKESVKGPMLIGAGRYLGYGLCLPRAEMQ